MNRTKRILTLTIIAFLTFSFGCNEGKKDVKLAEVGRNINLGLNEGVKFLRDAHNSKLIPDPPYAASLHAIKKIQTAADRANQQLDAIAVLDGTNKGAVIDALNGITFAIQDALNDPQIAQLPPDVKAKVDNVLLGFSLSLNVAKTIVAAIQQPTVTKSIKFQVQGVN